MAIDSMMRLNRIAATLCCKYEGRASTDVTGFGLLGHACNLATHQEEAVAFSIHTLPLIPKMKEVNDCVDFRLLQGLSAETSGGLLIALPPENVDAFCTDIVAIEGYPAWVIGNVVTWTHNDDAPRAFITPHPNLIQAPYHTFRKP
jgi:selenide,water dikinase